jgi:hypothetical protein
MGPPRWRRYDQTRTVPQYGQPTTPNPTVLSYCFPLFLCSVILTYSLFELGPHGFVVDGSKFKMSSEMWNARRRLIFPPP